MTSPDALRTHLGQARLSIRRAQYGMDRESRKTSEAELDRACALIDLVMRALAEPVRDSEAAE